MRRSALVSTIALAAALLASCTTSRPEQAAPAAPAAAPLSARPIPTQLPRNVRPLHYAIWAAPDAANMRFTGSTDADIQIFEATDRIVLNAAELEFDEVRIANAARGGQAPVAPADIDTDESAQTATFRFSRPLPPGRYRLTMNYRGRINRQPAGLFALDYSAGSEAKRALFTQFEAPDARRFFPGWDEPQFRTTYDLRVTVPAGQRAVSNMPEAGREPQRDGTTLVSFRRTPAMSSYLLFLGVGEFDRITTSAGDTEIGIVTRAGAGEQGRWALESSAALVPWYNEYFATPYPLPKLDNIAGPGSSQFFGAMENWGAIFSFEEILLVDPAITSAATRQSIFRVAAHEIAHQWFGNLVTMAWWDDLWLNEGFASWMGTKATAALHPEWEPLLRRIDGREVAMTLDSLVTTHPVVQRLTTVDQISQAFDAITYRKGEAVITMLEDYVGESGWRAGVRRYIARHRYGNTVTEDLWRAVESESGSPVTAIARDFTTQPGVPLIRVTGGECRNGRTAVSLTQNEFSRDRPHAEPLRWRVPVIAAAGAAETRTLVEGGSASLAVAGCGPLVVNHGQTGYYRTLYTKPLLARLTRDFARLRPVDQIGLIADNWALGLAGYQRASAALDMAEAAPAGGSGHLWSRIADLYGELYSRYSGDAARQAKIAAHASARLRPVLDRLGWTPRAGEAAFDPVLRAELIDALSKLGDPTTVAEARRRFVAGDISVTAGPLRSTLLGVIAENADSATWEQLRAQARAETNPLVKAQLYTLLGTPRDERLARAALALALTPEPGATTASEIIAAVADTHPDLALDFALRNRAAVDALVDSSSRSRFIARLGSGSSSPAAIESLEAYAREHLTPQSRGSVDRTIASIRDRIRSREHARADLNRWVDRRASQTAARRV